MSIRSSVIGPDAQRVADISSALPAASDSLALKTATGGIVEAAAEIERDQPDLLVIESPRVADGDLALLESSLLTAPKTTALLLAPEHSSEFLLKAMRAGVREVIPTPLVNGELAAALGRQLERLGLQRFASPAARVIAFVPAKGGSGATFLASSLAVELASRGMRTLLTDLNVPFGDAALYLTEARPTATLADLARQLARLDATLLDSASLSISDDLALLAAPDSVERYADVTAEAIDRILTVARSRYRFVILDAGRGIDPVTIRGLDRADEILLVAQASIPYLHAARRLIELFSGLGYDKGKLRLVLNRHERGAEISPADAARTLGIELAHLIPNSYRSVAWAVNHGQPIQESAPRDAVTRAIAQMAGRLMSKGPGEPGAGPGGSGGRRGLWH